MSTDDQDVIAFADCTRRFCEWAEVIEKSDDITLLAGHKILSELQLRALSLPRVEPSDVESEKDFEVDDWKILRDRLYKFPVNGYRKIFDVFAEDEAPVFCTIADDLADIYSDLKEGLINFDAGNDVEAIWHWRFTYFIHWGRHLTGVQTALHQHFADVLV